MFCTHCGAQQVAGAAFCTNCGRQPTANAAAYAAPARMTYVTTDDGATVIRRIADYERISGILWIVLGIIQVISVAGVIAGIWNIVAGSSRMKLVPAILERRSWVPADFEGAGGLIVIGLINLILGGVIGVLFVALDFYVRDKVLSNRHLFEQTASVQAPHAQAAHAAAPPPIG